jgi:hypothetical protein
VKLLVFRKYVATIPSHLDLVCGSGAQLDCGRNQPRGNPTAMHITRQFVTFARLDPHDFDQHQIGCGAKKRGTMGTEMTTACLVS